MAGVINKIRARVGLVIAIIGLAMAAFILNDVFSNITRLFNDEDRRDLAGKIGEQPVNAQAFSQMVQRRQQRNQLLGRETTANQLENQVWNEVVREEVLRAQFDPHGITVSDDEFYNMLFGDNPHRFAQQLRQAGLQSPQQLQRYLNQLQQQANQNNQQAATQLIRFQNFERQMVQQRRMEKLNTYVSAGLIPTTAKARRNIMNRKRQASGRILSVNYATIQDSAAADQLTEGDYESYYETHKARFEQDGPAAQVDYLAMPKQPSGRDSVTIRKKAFKYAEEFRTIQRDSTFAAQRTSFSIRNEQGPLFDFQWKPLEEFDLPTQRMIDTAQPPRVFPPKLRGARYEITKLVARSKADSLQRPNVSHILIPIAGNQKQDTLNAMAGWNSQTPSANSRKTAKLVVPAAKSGGSIPIATAAPFSNA